MRIMALGNGRYMRVDGLDLTKAEPPEPYKPEYKGQGGGQFKDAYGHSFKTSQGLAGHVARTGHPALVVPSVSAVPGAAKPQPQPKTAAEQYAAEGITPGGKQNENAMILLDWIAGKKVPPDAWVVKTPTGFRVDRAPDDPDERRNFVISHAFYNLLVAGVHGIDETLEKILPEYGYPEEEVKWLAANFQGWTNADNVAEMREAWQKKDPALMRFKEDYWKILQAILDDYHQHEDIYDDPKSVGKGTLSDMSIATGTKKIRVYRGLRVSTDQLEMVEGNIKNHGFSPVTLLANNADSWSIDRETAKIFMKGVAPNKERVLLEYDADKDDVLVGFPFVGFLSEREMVLGDIDSIKFEVEEIERKVNYTHVRIRKRKEFEKAKTPKADVEDVKFNLKGTNDWALEKHKHLPLATAINVARQYMRSRNRVRITKTKFDFTVSILPTEKLSVHLPYLGKALTPRDLGRDAITGIARLEEYFVESISSIWKRFTDRLLATLGRGPAYDALLYDLGVDLIPITDQHIDSVWAAVLNFVQTTEISHASFTQTDRTAIEMLRNDTRFLIPRIQEKFQAATGAFRHLIAVEYQRRGGVNLPELTRKLGEVAEGYRWEFERIARTETTRIANVARMTQWLKYVRDPTKKEYEWVVARDRRTCKVCTKVAAANPYTLTELKAATDNFVPHPNCRCTVVRNPK